MIFLPHLPSASSFRIFLPHLPSIIFLPLSSFHYLPSLPSFIFLRFFPPLLSLSLSPRTPPSVAEGRKEGRTESGGRKEWKEGRKERR
jgi:hypothetical protein